MAAENSALNYILKYIKIKNIYILNCNNISQYYSFTNKTSFGEYETS